MQGHLWCSMVLANLLLGHMLCQAVDLTPVATVSADGATIISHPRSTKAYLFDGGDLSLVTEDSDSPVKVQATGTPWSMDPDGSILYISSISGGGLARGRTLSLTWRLEEFVVGSDGALSSISGRYTQFDSCKVLFAVPDYVSGYPFSFLGKQHESLVIGNGKRNEQGSLSVTWRKVTGSINGAITGFARMKNGFLVSTETVATSTCNLFYVDDAASSATNIHQGPLVVRDVYDRLLVDRVNCLGSFNGGLRFLYISGRSVYRGVVQHPAGHFWAGLD